MASKKTAVATKKAQVQASQAPVQAQSPKAVAPKKDEVKKEALAIVKASNEQTLASIVRALNGTFAASEPRSGGSWYRIRLYAK